VAQPQRFLHDTVSAAVQQPVAQLRDVIEGWPNPSTDPAPARSLRILVISAFRADGPVLSTPSTHKFHLTSRNRPYVRCQFGLSLRMIPAASAILACMTAELRFSLASAGVSRIVWGDEAYRSRFLAS
jgi:hypothetical protein